MLFLKIYIFKSSINITNEYLESGMNTYAQNISRNGNSQTTHDRGMCRGKKTSRIWITPGCCLEVCRCSAGDGDLRKASTASCWVDVMDFPEPRKEYCMVERITWHRLTRNSKDPATTSRHHTEDLKNGGLLSQFLSDTRHVSFL